MATDPRIDEALRTADMCKVVPRLLLVARHHAAIRSRWVTQQTLHRLVFETIRQVRAGRHAHWYAESRTLFGFLSRVMIAIDDRATLKAEKRRKLRGNGKKSIS